MAFVKSINISLEKGKVKTPIHKATLKIDHGIVGDAHAGNWHRQISLLAEESINKMIALGLDDLNYGDFAENITTVGIEVHKLPVGTKLRIGNCLTEVTQIGKECHHGCEIFKKIGTCIMPKEGIFVKVLSEGEIFDNDEIIIEA